MNAKTTTIMFLMLTAIVPLAGAQAPPLVPTCTNYDAFGGVHLWAIGEHFYFPLTQVEGAYVPQGSIWQESNGNTSFECEAVTLPDGTVIPPDTPPRVREPK